jgi:AraC-like DNA-binding protein
MLYEPTTLAAAASAIADAVRQYGCDAATLFRRAELEPDAISEPGARYPMQKLTRLWGEARRETGDPCIGLIAGQKIKPPALHALGMSWLASPTLLDGLRRIERYVRIANSAMRVTLEETDGQVVLTVGLEAEGVVAADEGVDMALAVIVRLCRLMTDRHFAPVLVTMRHADNGHVSQYIDYFQSPVSFDADRDSISFDAASLRQALPAGNRALASHNDRLAERYLATLNPERTRDRVRELLLTLMSSGDVNQETVASSLHLSVSSLQRQLKAEGITYRQILDDTRRSLAEDLVRENRYSLSQIAYLLGFSDQANFSRAFKRWTGKSPGVYMSHARN